MKLQPLSILLILLFTSKVYSQENTIVVIQDDDNKLRFTVGNSYYSTTYKGIKSYMTDLKQLQPELYNELLPQFENLTLKRNVGIGTAAGGFVIGSAFMISAFTDDMNMDSQDAMDSDFSSGATALFVGLGIIGATGLIAVLIFPDEDDYLSWVNHHNRINSKTPIQWRIGLKSFPNKQIGATLTMRF